ncbi:TIGR03546 family protein [Gayadomonas joobiniege]|uniref:TIGR03546 family protein n=1 Tax=Gayadomonas joobiniege TaxID=1234606 RepID=UPI00036B5B78|nr:TIGR03546 family protein [Gayadomonas joobiniege]
MLTQILKLFIALNSEDSPKQIAYAFALGMIIGLTPLLSLHNLIILFIAFLVRVHLGAFFVSFALFAIVGELAEQPFAQVGEYLLTMPALESMWQSLYQFTFFKLAHLHHTLTLGGLVIGLVLFFPIVYLINYLVLEYRVHVMAYILKLRVVQMLKSTRIFQMYEKLQGV